MVSAKSTGLELTVSKHNQGKSRRIEIRAEEEWAARIEAQAERLGMNASTYIREAVTRKLEADESTDPSLAKPRRKPPT